MSAFSNFLRQEQEASKEANFNDGGKERYQPPQKVIRLTKDQPEMYVRILPGVKSQDDPEGVKFSSKFRSIFLNYKKADGQVKSSNFTLPFEIGSSVLDKFLSQWKDQQIKFNAYDSMPSKRYYINVIPLVVQNRQFQYATDQQGNLIVAPMEITNTLYESIIKKLQDELLAPTDDSDLSFISENHAYPLKLYRRGERTDTTYDIEIYQNQDLGALPQGWQNNIADLERMVEPTEEIIPSFVNYVINSLSGTDTNTKNFDFEDGNSNNNQPTPTQEQVDNQMPFNMQQQQQQQQQQPEQSQNNNPFSGFNASNFDDNQVPFNTQPEQPQNTQWQQPNQQQNVQQPTQNQQQFQQSQTQYNQPEQQQQDVNIPQQQKQQAQPKSVDAILGNMDLGI